MNKMTKRKCETEKWITLDDDLYIMSQSPEKSQKTTKKSDKLKKVPFSVSEPSLNCSGEPWCDLYRPSCSTDLSIHSSRLKQITKWFDLLTDNRNRSRGASILLVAGPSGCAKTTVLKVIAKEYGFEVVEFMDEQVSESSNGSRLYYSKSEQINNFKQFLKGAQRQRVTLGNEECPKRIIFLKDLPILFLREPHLFSPILKEFHLTCKVPLVFIMTDNKFLQTKLFPQSVTSEMSDCFEEINFLPVNDQLMRRGLLRVLKIIGKESLKGSKSDVLDRLIDESNGDIRLAINNLQLVLCSRTNSVCSNIKINTDNSRDNAIEYVRVIGRVLHNKREQTESVPESTLPYYLQKERRKTLSFAPENDSEMCEMRPDQLVAFLQQNYVDFVQLKSEEYDCVDVMSRCADYLSDASWLTRVSSSMNWTMDQKHEVGHITAKDYTWSIAARGVAHSFTPNAPEKEKRSFYKPLVKPHQLTISKQASKFSGDVVNAFGSGLSSIDELFIDRLPFLTWIMPSFYGMMTTTQCQLLRQFETWKNHHHNEPKSLKNNTFLGSLPNQSNDTNGALFSFSLPSCDKLETEDIDLINNEFDVGQFSDDD